jgi:hypothetical protein
MMCFLEGSIKGWTQPEVIAQEVLAITTLLTLVYFLWSFKKTLGDTYYAALDTMYFDLLKIAVERPYLMDPASLKDDGEKQKQYDAYAFMVWNFVETIFDRCGTDKQLCATWYPVVDTEAARHRQWFDRPANRGKFKQSFKDFIEKRYPQPRIESQPGVETKKEDAFSAKSGQPGA